MKRFKALLITAFMAMAMVPVMASPAAAVNTSYPAKPYMDAWYSHFRSNGYSVNQSLCYGAYYAMYQYTKDKNGNENWIMAPYWDSSSKGFALLCPGKGDDGHLAQHANHWGITAVGGGRELANKNYVSVQCGTGTSKDLCRTSLTLTQRKAMVYYVLTHETGHAYAWYWWGTFDPPGYDNPMGSDIECWADDFMRHVGGTDQNGYCG